MMRGGQYGGAESGYNSNNNTNTLMLQQQQQQQHQHISSTDQFHGQLEAFTPERDPHPSYPPNPTTAEGHWRWEQRGDNNGPNMPMPLPLPPLPLPPSGQGMDLSRSYFPALDKQNKDDRSNMDIGYGMAQTFEGLERKFLDDIMKLDKEHKDAEDAEIARHRERINGINMQYQEKLNVVRGRHASRRDDFLKKESQIQHKHNNNNLRGQQQDYTNISEAYITDHHHHHHHHDSYRPRSSARDQGFQPRPSYPQWPSYDRYYQ